MRSKLKRWENAGSLNAMIRMASARKPFQAADIGEFDGDPLLLAVANGVIDLRTGALAQARPEQKLTKALAVAYDPTARCPRFVRFLTEIFPNGHPRPRQVHAEIRRHVPDRVCSEGAPAANLLGRGCERQINMAQGSAGTPSDPSPRSRR